MNKKIKRILSAFAAGAIMTSMFASGHVQAVEDNDILTPEVGIEDSAAQTYTEMCKGMSGDYSFTMWKDPDSGRAEFTPYENGCFDCSWSDTEEPEFYMGKTTSCGITSINSSSYMKYNYNYEYIDLIADGTKELKLGYEADISSDDGYFFGASCKVVSPWETDYVSKLLLVGEAYSGMDFLKERNLIGSVSVNSVVYDIYDGAVTLRDVENYDPSLFPKSLSVYWIMRRESLDISDTVKGTVDLKAIIDKFNCYNDKYSTIQTVTEPQLCVRGFGRSGSVKVIKNDITVEKYPDEELRNNEEITRGGAVWSVEQNENAVGKALVFSNGNMEYKWTNEDDNAHCFIKSSADIEGNPLYYDTSDLYCETAFKIIFDNKESEKYAVGICGTIGRPNVEYYIISSCEAPEMLRKTEFINSISTIEGHFDIYRQYTDTDTEYGKIIRFFSVYKPDTDERKYNSGFDCHLENHIKMWKAYGLKYDNVLSVSSFAEVSGKSSGHLNLKMPFIESGNPPFTEYRYEVSDSNFNKYDLEELQLYLLGDDYLPENKDFDINEDGVIDVYDLIKLRKLIVRMENGLPSLLDPDTSSYSHISNEDGSYGNWSWGQSHYDDEGSIEAAASNTDKFIGQWENSSSAYFYRNISKREFYDEEDPDYKKYIKYEYDAKGEGSFIVGAAISPHEQLNPILLFNTVYIAESYNDLSFIDEAIASGSASALGTIKTSDGTEYEVIKNKGEMGTEVFVLRTEPNPLGEDAAGTLLYDDILDNIKELVPEISAKYMTVSFGSKCFDRSRGYFRCFSIADQYSEYYNDHNYY